MISCSDHPLSWVQHIAFRKKGKMNFWPQTVQMKKGKQARRISCGKLRSSQALQVRQRWPQNLLYANSCPVDLYRFCSMTLVSLLPKFPPDFHTQVSKSVRLPPFIMDWKVHLGAIPGHLMCILHGLLWGTVMGGVDGSREQGAAVAEIAFVWGHPSEQEQLWEQSGDFLLTWMVLWIVAEDKEEGARSRQNVAERTAPHEKG